MRRCGSTGGWGACGSWGFEAEGMGGETYAAPKAFLAKEAAGREMEEQEGETPGAA